MPQAEYTPNLGGLDPYERAIANVRAMVASVARSEANVLIVGERGVFKERIARAIHAQSPFKHRPFVRFSRLELDDRMIEWALFGESLSEEGLPTVKAAEPYCDSVRGGTLFIEEIADFSPRIRARLARLCERRHLSLAQPKRDPSGPARIILTTRHDLLEGEEAGTDSREEVESLYAVTIPVPPLRDRKAERVELAQAFLRWHAMRNARPACRLSAAAVGAVLAYDWPGNLRELDLAMQRAALVAPGDCVQSEHLPPRLRLSCGEAGAGEDTLAGSLNQLERTLIEDALRRCKGNQAKAAVELGVTERLIGLRIRKYRIDPRRFRTSA